MGLQNLQQVQCDEVRIPQRGQVSDLQADHAVAKHGPAVDIRILAAERGGGGLIGIIGI